MRGLLSIWGFLGAICVLFLLWHTPLRGPLSADELAGTLERSGLQDEFPPRIIEFFLTDDGQPFYMVNLHTFSEGARYPGEAPPGVRTGADAAEAYGRAVIPELLQRGSYPLLTTRRLTTFRSTMGATAAAFESMTVVRYRSRRDLLDMLTSPSFREAVVHKWASLEENLIAPSQRELYFDPVTFLTLTLLFAGGLATGGWLIARGRREQCI